jgi:ATP-dependent Lhr-like helicase
VSAADPLNITGILTPGSRIPALTSNRILFRDGIPVAVREGRETRFLTPMDPAAEWQARQALVRRAGALSRPAPSAREQHHVERSAAAG